MRRPSARRVAKVLAGCLATVIVIPALLLGVVVVGANTGFGRHLIENLTPRLTGDMVRIEGIDGRFPDALRLRRLTVADDAGIWLTVDDAVLDWSPLRLVHGLVAIDRLEAHHVAVDRLPVSSSQSGGGMPPVPRISLSRLAVAQLEIGAALSGQPIVLAVAGSGDATAVNTGAAHVTITAPGSNSRDHYIVDGSMDPAGLHATLSVAEAPHGLISGLVGLPDLGAITAEASAEGPLNALTTRAAIQAGQSRLGLDGKVDAISRAADLTFSVTAPAMSPSPDVGWASIRLEGTVHGPLEAPEATGTLAADQVTAGGAVIGSLRADISGDANGETKVQARVEGIRVPGASPDVLSGGPLTLDATAKLREANKPVRFSLRHQLFAAEGTADRVHGEVRLTVPDLTPLAGIGGVDLHGKSDLTITGTRSGDTTNLTMTGTFGIAGGIDPVPALVGDAGNVEFAASVHRKDVMLHRLAVSGPGVRATASGQYVGQQLGMDWTFALSDVGLLRPGASGAIQARGHVGGPPNALVVTADVTGDIAGEVGRVDQFIVHLDVAGLPKAPSGNLRAGGAVLGAPVDVAVVAQHQDGGFHLVIERASWKSLAASGTLDLASGAALPTGGVALSMTHLADLSVPLGRPIAGELTAFLESTPNTMRINSVVTGGAFAGAGSIAKMVLDATVTDPAGHPSVDGSLTLDRLDAGGVRASGRLTAKGATDDLTLTVAAKSEALHGVSAAIDAAGSLNASTRLLSLASLRGEWGNDSIRLLAPARVSLDQGVTVDRLRLGLRQAELAIAGGLKQGSGGGGLDLRVTLQNLPADVFTAFAPTYAADGAIAGEARLIGSAARPEGSIRLTATGLRMRAGPGRALPMGGASVVATLDGSNARVDGKVTAGGSNVTASGRVPLDLARAMDIRIGGNVDLGLMNPLLSARGRGIKGQLELALAATGPPAAPRVNGTIRLSNGDVQDASLGVRISAITAVVRADGDMIRLDRFDGKAGQGTISVSGTITTGGTPTVDLTLRANNARVLSSDLATATVDANLTLRGPVTGTPALAGTVRSRTVEIRVPEKLPPSIATLPVRNGRSGRAKSPPPTAPPDLTLNLTLDAPSQIYIRGRGVDAELGGSVRLGGTAAHPLPEGGFHLRRGTFALAGQSLNLTEGTVDFAGGDLTNPPLKLIATSISGGLTATLTVSGEAKNPKITLSSVPDMPQDEILSQLLFHTASTRLSPFQVAQIAAALASISGVGSPGGDPLGRVRSALGLDQLTVGTDASGGATLRAGRYVAQGVRVGAARGVSGDTQATVQIDIAKGLKLETTAGTGSTATTGTPGTSTGTSLGLTYQFEY